jgi:hypothetical protein
VVSLIGRGLKNVDTKYCYKLAVLMDYKILKLMGIIKMAERQSAIIYV